MAVLLADLLSLAVDLDSVVEDTEECLLCSAVGVPLDLDSAVV